MSRRIADRCDDPRFDRHGREDMLALDEQVRLMQAQIMKSLGIPADLLRGNEPPKALKAMDKLTASVHRAHAGRGT